MSSAAQTDRSYSRPLAVQSSTLSVGKGSAAACDSVIQTLPAPEEFLPSLHPSDRQTLTSAGMFGLCNGRAMAAVYCHSHSLMAILLLFHCTSLLTL